MSSDAGIVLGTFGGENLDVHVFCLRDSRSSNNRCYRITCKGLPKRDRQYCGQRNIRWKKEREFGAYYQKQSAPPPVKAAVDVDAVPEKQTIERLIKLVLDEKPARFSSQLLQIFTQNYSTKLGQGGYGAVFKGQFPDGRPLAVKLLHNDGLDKRIEEQFMAEIADFGLAKLCNQDSTNMTMSRVGGTPDMQLRDLDDVCRESQEWFPKQVWENFDKGEMEEIWENCEIEEKDREKAKTMVSVALWCVQYLPEARPSMRNVVKILEGGAEAATPPNPFRHLISSANVHSITVSRTNSTADYYEDDRDDSMRFIMQLLRFTMHR
ncbi:putative S-locus lectin protein kinase family protein [Hibiscus syriacus]|uniref:S-locus lectin protein kinase family protein n=1 Tax=Hibiscus syriacus TaxID=106335 RepID=A0A6A2YLW2_HIBSY|nr:putative S-locus lectin protein kinase family protein [Hibiscus syriacus]